ncbi:MAG: polyhydroxyalkanoate synthesis repressor PhaR [Bdellovibrionales bacterium]
MTEPVIIKKYANRRLYNTASSTYVTLETLAEMVRDNIDFIVYDAKSGEDLTRSVLTQIIVEQEAKGTNLLPIGFLRQLISMYGGNMQWAVPGYLDEMMKHFGEQQKQLQSTFQQSFGKLFPPGSPMEAISKQNMALFEQMAGFFMPFKQANDKEREETLNALKQKMSSMERGES